jgi:hypothetical protein
MIIQGNIFIGSKGQALLADFGLAVIGDSSKSILPTTSNFAGVIQWVAPELVDGKGNPVRKSAMGDMFAFGRLCLVASINHETLVDVTLKCVDRYALRNSHSQTQKISPLSSKLGKV